MLTSEKDIHSDKTSVGPTEAKREKLATPKIPFDLIAGGKLDEVWVEYETYGNLSDAKDNVVLIEHALSGDAHAAGWDKNTKDSGRSWREKKPGWWDTMIGPGKPIDTDRYFVICSNVLGSCYGTTGPSSINPATGAPYGLTFPMITVSDWVNLQKMLLEKLGIEKIYAVVGGSLGGQQALEWALRYPEAVGRCIILASSAKLSAQGLAFNAVGRHSIMNDLNFNNGNYYSSNLPETGLAAARMLAHITYLSEEGLHRKFGRRLQDKKSPNFDFNVEFEVESYLDYQGRAFVERFDANSYLYITRAMDYYDAADIWGGGSLQKACERIKANVLVASFSSDWLYTPTQSKELALAVSKAKGNVTFAEIKSPYGHDAFLVETKPVGRLLSGFLNSPLGNKGGM